MKKYAFFIGIDMSKKWFDASLTIDGEKEQMPHKRFDNNTSGFKALICWLASQSKKMKTQGSWLFCMEHTGVYTLPLCVFLQQQSHDFILESGLRIKRSLGIRRGKTDKADSKDIALYVYLNANKLKTSQLAAEELMHLKNLLSYRARLVKQRVALKTSSGEYKGYMPKEYTLPIIEQDSRELISFLTVKIQAAEKQMKLIVDENPELKKLYDLCVSVKGIGSIIAITLLVFTNGFKAFDNARKFACYIGIAPFARQSGSRLNIEAKVSKLAYTKIKTLIGNGVNSAIRYDKELRLYYERRLAEGKSKYKVINAVKNKIIGRVFATVKRGTPYVELFNYT